MGDISFGESISIAALFPMVQTISRGHLVFDHKLMSNDRRMASSQQYGVNDDGREEMR